MLGVGGGGGCGGRGWLSGEGGEMYCRLWVLR